MTTKINMPRLSETMSDGKIVSWLKKAGDHVKVGEVIAEVETDKANMEVEALDEGTLSRILVEEGQVADVGSAIAELDGSEISEIKHYNNIKETKIEKNKDIKTELPPPMHNHKKEKEVKVSEVKEIKKEVPPKRSDLVKVSPLAKRIIRKEKIDVSQVTGSGPDGRILEKDVLKLLSEKKMNEEFKEQTIQKVEEQKTTEKIVGQTTQKNVAETINLSRMRKTIAKRMVESKQNIPHFYVSVDVIADELIKVQKNIFETKGLYVTYTDIFIKLLAEALDRYPLFNSSYKDDFVEIYKDINIGMVFAVPDGLLVPVIHDCKNKCVEEIAKATSLIKEKVLNNKLQPKDVTGGTFSISNMGMFGVKEFNCIINPPEVAGIAIGEIQERVISIEREMKIASVFTATLSSDHRVIQGVDAAEFLREFKRIAESYKISDQIWLSE